MAKIFNTTGLLMFQNCEMNKADAIEAAKRHCEPNSGVYIFGSPNDAPKKVGMIPQMMTLIDYFVESVIDNEAAVDYYIGFWEHMPVGVCSELILRKFMAKMLVNPKFGAFGVSKQTDYYLKIVSELYDNEAATKNDFEQAYDKITNSYYANCNPCAANAAPYAANATARMAISAAFEDSDYDVADVADYSISTYLRSLIAADVTLCPTHYKSPITAQIKLFKEVLLSCK